MSALDALVSGRAAALSQMVDSCTIRKPGSRIFNQQTGDYEETLGDLLYDGPCQVQVPNVVEQEPTAGEAVFTMQVAIVKVPVSVLGVTVNSLVTITASVADADLVGRHFRVAALSHKSFLTARRLRCEEVTG